MAGIFTCKYLDFAVILIIKMNIVIQPFRCYIVMLINGIYQIIICLGCLSCPFPCPEIAAAPYIRAWTSDQFYLRIFLMNCLFKHFISSIEIHGICLPLLVSNSQIFQMERTWMSHFCSFLSPFRGHIPVRILNQIQCILDIFLHLKAFNIHFLRGHKLAGKPYIHNRQWLCTQILT